MVYGFVKQSKGHIRTDSKVGKGTTITLYLPALLDQSVTSRKRVAKTLKLPMSLGETIMVVEDDPFVRETSVSLLSSLGYKVIEAGSGVVARDLLLTGVRPDLMFTDVLMPGSMSGIDLGREAVKKNPNLKILYTSGYTEQKDGENRGIEPTPLLRKPYSEADLARKIREVLGD
jgi:CheY-like chemotaxis protein